PLRPSRTTRGPPAPARRRPPPHVCLTWHAGGRPRLAAVLGRMDRRTQPPRRFGRLTMNRPVLRYHGGKWNLAPWSISHFPKHRIYVEPFGGAASVLLRKPRTDSEVYNDLYGEVVNLFRVLRNPTQARELIRIVTLTPYSRQEFEDAYIADGDPIEQARRTLVRAYLGFE